MAWGTGAMTIPANRSAIKGPLFKWFGSKWSAAPHYPAPEHDTIIEPFAGSAGYSLRYSHKNICLAESNPHIHALWTWLINEATTDDILSIPVHIPEGTDIRNMGLNKGQQLLLKTWQRTNNVGDCWTVSPWGNLPGQWTVNTRARVSSEIHAIKHWNIYKCGIELMKSAQKTASWFIDPPYLYNYQYKSSLVISYQELGELIQSLSGQLIACEAACKKTGAIPDYLSFVDFRKTVTSRRKLHQSHHSRELLFHRPSYVSPDLFALASAKHE